MNSKGNAILEQKQDIANAVTPQEVNTKEFSQLLAEFVNHLNTFRLKVIEIQTETHSQFENCRARKRQHESTILNKKASISSLQEKISSEEAEISSCEADIPILKKGAEELESRAHDIAQAAEESEDTGIFGIIAGIAGVVFAPLTGKGRSKSF